MSFSETFLDAIESLRGHKLRASLSMLGMIFGVGAVIAMLSIGEGAEQQALEMVERLGLRNIVIETKELAREDLMEIREVSPGLTSRDIDAIVEAVPGIEWVAPRVKIEPYKVMTDGASTSGMAYGVSRYHFDRASFRLAEGRFLDALDERNHAQVCVIGSKIGHDLFGYDTAIGETLKVNDVWLEVVGVLESDIIDRQSLQGVRLSSTAGEVYMPYSTALRKFDHPPLDSPYDQIVVRVTSDVSPWETTAVIDPLLQLLHGGAEDYTIIIPEELLAQSRHTQRLFNIVMGCIAGISLLVGGIGIMNIMLASVLERTREIGIRRAVGARQQDIRFQFIVESFSISLIGGVAGIFMGAAIAHIIAFYAEWPTLVTVWSVAISSGVSVTVGILSGLYPATRAAQLDPVVALGYE